MAEPTPEWIGPERVEQIFTLADEILRAPARFTKAFVVENFAAGVADLAGRIDRYAAELAAANERAEAARRCTSACDPDCDADCHETHQVPYKRKHQPEECRGRKSTLVAELEQLRQQAADAIKARDIETAIAKNLLQQNIELGTRADNAEAQRDDALARLAEIGKLRDADATSTEAL